MSKAPAMNLEVITRQPETTSRKTPLLFVHGAWHGAWCWEDTFLPHFARQGYAAHALSLRGHGESAGRDRLRWTRIRDYVADVEQVVATLDPPPVIIAHSLGGFVIQKYLESNRPPAAVLLAPIPTHGALPFYLRFFARHPLAFLKLLFTLSPYHMVGTPELTHEGFFSPDMPQEQVNTHFARIQEESFRAALDVALLDLPRPKRVITPMLVLGAANDRIFTVSEIEKTARAYHTDAEIFPDMAHDMMLDSGWEGVADRILAWLDERDL